MLSKRAPPLSPTHSSALRCGEAQSRALRVLSLSLIWARRRLLEQTVAYRRSPMDDFRDFFSHLVALEPFLAPSGGVLVWTQCHASALQSPFMQQWGCSTLMHAGAALLHQTEGNYGQLKDFAHLTCWQWALWSDWCCGSMTQPCWFFLLFRGQLLV